MHLIKASLIFIKVGFATRKLLPVKIAAAFNNKHERIENIFEPVREKTNNLGSNQVRHKPGCTLTQDG